MPSTAKSEEPVRRGLNPEAPVWCQKHVKEPTPGQNSVLHAISVTPPKGNIQLLLQQQQETIMVLTLLQPEVPVFSGKPIGYCKFVRAFENLGAKNLKL